MGVTVFTNAEVHRFFIFYKMCITWGGRKSMYVIVSDVMLRQR